MGRVIYTNNSDRIVYIGGRSVFPGSAREVDERDVPGFRAPSPVADEPAAADPVRVCAEELLALPVAAIRAELGGVDLPTLTAMAECERNGRNRRTLLQAIEAERLRRAAEQAATESSEGAK